MYYLRLLFIIKIFLLNSIVFFAQDKRIDLLERLYQQENFKKTLKKSNKLITKKGYDNSPEVHLFQLAALINLKKDKRYTSTHKNVKHQIEQAKYTYVKLDPNLKAYHKYEHIIDDIVFEKDEKIIVITDEKKQKNKEEEIKKANREAKKVKVIVNDSSKNDTVYSEFSTQDRVILYAETFMGIPYKYGGRDENGFDCSGFTGYIMESFGYSLARSARDQKAQVDKIPIKQAKKGDLVFFGKSKSNISHVGIVVSEIGEELTMIHSSSSRGIMISNVMKSTYWRPKLVSAGRVIK